MDFISFVVVGMKFRGLTTKEVLEQDQLRIVHDKENAHDPEAMAIYSPNNEHLGYISRDNKPDTKMFEFDKDYTVIASNANGPGSVEVVLGIPQQPIIPTADTSREA